MNTAHDAIRRAQVADLDAAIAALSGADKAGALSGAIATLTSLRLVLAETEDLRLALLAHNASPRTQAP